MLCCFDKLCLSCGLSHFVFEVISMYENVECIDQFEIDAGELVRVF